MSGKEPHDRRDRSGLPGWRWARSIVAGLAAVTFAALPAASTGPLPGSLGSPDIHAEGPPPPHRTNEPLPMAAYLYEPDYSVREADADPGKKHPRRL